MQQTPRQTGLKQRISAYCNVLQPFGYSKEEIERFLTEADSAMDRAENSQRGSFWSNELNALSRVMVMTGLKIIRKYDVQDVSVKISYVRSASSLEKDPVKVAALDKEFDELSALYAAQSRRKKL